MTQQDENDLTDGELLKMWERAEPVEVTQPSDTPVPEKPAEKSSPSAPARRKKSADRRGT